MSNLTKKEKVLKFNEDFGYYNRDNRQRLEKIAYKNQNLVNKFILGKSKNPFYTPNNTTPITYRDNEYYALIQWIIPRENFNYKIVKPSEFCNDKNVFRSGIIPVVKKDGLNYWLLGNFHDYENTRNPILADFGGRCERGKRGEIDQKDYNDPCPALFCAIRETYEESKGLLPKMVDEAINNGDMVIYQGKNYKGTRIYFTIVELEYDDVKDVIEKFKIVPLEGKEIFGNLNLYDQRDVKSGKYRTAKNLTDFLHYLRNI